MNNQTANAFLYATIVAMGGLIFGLDAALISGAEELIGKEFELSPIERGSIVAAPALGVLIALPFAGFFADRLGRKWTIIIVAMLYLVSAITSAFAPSETALYWARFLGGLAFSSISLASMYIGEIAPPKWRGKLVSMTQINIVIGLSGAYFVNYIIKDLAGSGAAWVQEWGVDEHTWRWMLGSEIPFAMLWLGLLFLIPESPYWYALKDRSEDTIRTLNKVLPEEEITPHVAELRESLEKSSNDRSISSQLKELFSTRMRLTFIIALTLAIAQQSTGINAVLFYAQTVFKQLGIGENAAFQSAVWLGLTGLLFTVLGLLLVDKLGRRPMIIWGMVWIIASLGLGAYAFHNARYVLTSEAITEISEEITTGEKEQEEKETPDAKKLRSLADQEYSSDIQFKLALKEALGEDDAAQHQNFLLEKAARIDATLVLVCILSFIAAFHFSVGPVMWVLFSEIFPASVRGIAIPFFTIITSLTSWLVQKFFPWQLENWGMSSILLFYAATVAIGLVIMFLTLVETKNMSIEEIQAKLSPSVD